MDACLRNWHEQRHYCTLEVDNPGFTLPQPKPCPLIWTADQFDGSETPEYRAAREDGIIRSLGSFLKKEADLLALEKEGQRIRQRAKQDFNRWKRHQNTSNQRQAHFAQQHRDLIDDLKRISIENEGRNDEKALVRAVQQVPLGQQDNVSYPDRYRREFEKLREHQQRHEPTANVIIQKSPEGCGRMNDPACLEGHNYPGTLQCPWLMAHRHVGNDTGFEELQVSPCYLSRMSVTDLWIGLGRC